MPRSQNVEDRQATREETAGEPFLYGRAVVLC